MRKIKSAHLSTLTADIPRHSKKYALLAGLYDGAITVKTLKQHGDFDVWTFDSLDGAMVVVDGRVYRVAADAHANLVADGKTTPDASVTSFAAEQRIELLNAMPVVMCWRLPPAR